MCSSQRAAEPSSAPLGRPSRASICGETKILSAADVPVEDEIAGAREGQRPPLGVGDQSLGEGTAGEGVLDHR